MADGTAGLEGVEELGSKFQSRIKGLDMPAGLTDILSSNGKHIFMRSQKFDKSFKRLETRSSKLSKEKVEDGDRHIFCAFGFLESSWMHRIYWVYGSQHESGYNGWWRNGLVAPARRILVSAEDAIYGYGRLGKYWSLVSALEYQLFSAKKTVDKEKAVKAITLRNHYVGWSGLAKTDGAILAPQYNWQRKMPPLQARAMVSAGDKLVVAGIPDVVDEEKAHFSTMDPGVQKLLEKQKEAVQGKHGGILLIVDKKTGEPVARRELTSPPVWDGMLCAYGKIYVACVDGTVVCLD